MMVRKRYKTGMSLVGLCMLLCTASPASADVSPGDVIDKTNWQKVEGLLPLSVLDWVKKGEVTTRIAPSTTIASQNQMKMRRKRLFIRSRSRSRSRRESCQ